MNQNLHDSIRDQAGASRQRLEDAKVLLRASRWRGSMYIAGYAVECLLKTKLMQIYDCKNLRDLEWELQRRFILSTHRTVFTHQLADLLKLAPGSDRLKQNRELWPLFNNVNRWTPNWRYTPKLAARPEATEFITSVERIMHWINNNL